MKKVLLLIALCVASVGNVMAQVDVEATIDSIETLIGKHVHVTLKTIVKEKSKVDFPAFKPLENVIPGVEVLGRSDEQVQQRDNGFLERSVVYTLTSFEDTLYYLPPFVVKVDGKPYKSKSLALKVITLEVDTLHPEKFFGPKDVQENPFQWSDWSMVFWLSILMVILSIVGYYLYLRLRDNKPIVSHLRIVKRLLPHQKAMKEIERLKADHIVTSEDSKEYYTKLTDTLRKYMEERYGFNAMEMTSSEIIEHLSRQDSQSLDELRVLFQTADLVKFAKYSTLINENDANLVSAIDFINKTKQENPLPDENVRPVLTKEEQRTANTRLALKIFILVISLLCLALLVYVVYATYQLIN